MESIRALSVFRAAIRDQNHEQAIQQGSVSG